MKTVLTSALIPYSIAMLMLSISWYGICRSDITRILSQPVGNFKSCGSFLYDSGSLYGFKGRSGCLCVAFIPCPLSFWICRKAVRTASKLVNSKGFSLYIIRASFRLGISMPYLSRYSRTKLILLILIHSRLHHVCQPNIFCASR